MSWSIFRKHRFAVGVMVVPAEMRNSWPHVLASIGCRLQIIAPTGPAVAAPEGFEPKVFDVTCGDSRLIVGSWWCARLGYCVQITMTEFPRDQGLAAAVQDALVANGCRIELPLPQPRC